MERRHDDCSAGSTTKASEALGYEALQGLAQEAFFSPWREHSRGDVPVSPGPVSTCHNVFVERLWRSLILITMAIDVRVFLRIALSR